MQLKEREGLRVQKDKNTSEQMLDLVGEERGVSSIHSEKKERRSGSLTDFRSGLGAVQCCRAHPAGFPGTRTGWGRASSHKQQERSPGDRSPPPSTNPAGEGGSEMYLKPQLRSRPWQALELSLGHCLELARSVFCTLFVLLSRVRMSPFFMVTSRGLFSW